MSRVGPGTDARFDLFSRATMRLAVLFSAIVVVLVVAAGVLIDASITADLHNAIDLKVPNEAEERRLVAEAIDNIRRRIVIVDSVVIVAVGLLGVWYARRTLRPIRETYLAQKRFVADASHELRTPLAIVKADFDVALWDEEPRLEGEALRRDLGEVERMASIVDDLLLLSRIDARQEVLQPAPLDLAALARRSAGKLEPLAARKGVAVSVMAQGAVTVPGDAPHLERALLNVLKNAIEHSPAGTEVHMTVDGTGDEARVEVSDRGEGLSPEELEHVFERFYRAEGQQSDRGGSGLGLSIAEWVVSGHGGRIAAASTPGHGTTMRIALPLAR